MILLVHFIIYTEPLKDLWSHPYQLEHLRVHFHFKEKLKENIKENFKDNIKENNKDNLKDNFKRQLQV